MSESHRSIHLRTGRGPLAWMVDAWLGSHGFDVVGFEDVYGACVHLLSHAEYVPDIAAVGCDWLRTDELGILSLVHQTWPRASLLLYGDHVPTLPPDILPLAQAVRGEAELRAMCEKPPGEWLERLVDRNVGQAAWTMRATSARVFPSQPADARSPRAAKGDVSLRLPPVTPVVPFAEEGLAAYPRAPDAPPRASLTPEELAALLDTPKSKP